ncbi:uncharacterized protein LOC128665799 [Bombina bombina]|uniref:uncharacterized protein LOC128665798 n=1 Tax=Bombina bombina TaxID=8345 RepID=UPI00235A4987|nr:uncharacterized protein LOC128665798 [Bombina bombina]XP_053575980.1 uncharacterized protein LOC128665799 [Bombina bombina]
MTYTGDYQVKILRYFLNTSKVEELDINPKIKPFNTDRMTTNKFRRAYSLRIPRSPKPAFVDTSGFYDRLEEAECPEDPQVMNEISGNRDSTNFSWDVPLIDEAPKLQHCRKKWISRSLRVPKTRLADEGLSAAPTEEIYEKEDISGSWNDPANTNPCEKQKESDVSQKEKEAENEEDKQKCKKMKHYKKSIDRAFRRGWENFLTNIYTISLTRTSQDAPQLVKAF